MRTGVNSTRQSIKKVRTKQTWEPKVGTVFSPFSVANGERKNEPIQTHSNVSSLGYARGSRWQNLMASLPKDRGNLHFLGWDFVCLFCRFNFQRKIHTAQGHGKGGWMSTKKWRERKLWWTNNESPSSSACAISLADVAAKPKYRHRSDGGMNIFFPFLLYFSPLKKFHGRLYTTKVEKNERSALSLI